MAIDIDLLYNEIKIKRISLNQLAKQMGMSNSYLCLMLNNKREMKVSVLNKILKTTGIKINKIAK